MTVVRILRHFVCEFSVYSFILDTWAKIVAEDLIPALPLEDVDKESRKLLEMEFFRMICQNNILNSLMGDLEVSS